MKSRPSRFRLGLRRNGAGMLFMAPWITGFFAFVAFPLGYSLYMSFHTVQIRAGGIVHSPVGVQYYREILISDGGILYDDLLPFLRQALIMIVIILLFSLLVSMLLNQRFWGRTFFRVIFFLPVIFSSGLVLNELIVQGEGSLGFLGGPQTAAFINTYLPESWARPVHSVLNSFVLVLWYSGVQILIFLAGRQTIPSSVYEAARIDGADPWSMFWKITLPGLAPFISLNLIYTVVDLFTFPTNPIIQKVNTDNYGFSSALAWIYFAIVLFFIGLALFVYGRVMKVFGGQREGR